MSNLDITDSDRNYMNEMRMLGKDQDGNEVMVGLTREETLRMLEHNRRFLANDRDRSKEGRADYLKLHEKHERVRMQILSAENEARNLKGPMH
ncbi:hypothetical protein [Pseudomonas fluorescens]|uniref:hypothetical protein n=1 Tax=Pseudomonas fluorescens TaxID=294 RepID=UPI000F48D99D|nr:hypothetical protein [Pseudomonas fluorescens]RON88445.1 hypothetical protein BK668_15935 [Pseudomonas fluorescens]